MNAANTHTMSVRVVCRLRRVTHVQTKRSLHLKITTRLDILINLIAHNYLWVHASKIEIKIKGGISFSIFTRLR